jgi:hypothetical protein
LNNENVNIENSTPKNTVNIRNIDSPNRNSESSLRNDVFSELKQNEGLSPKEICKRLALAYKVYGHSVRTYKCQYKRQYQIRLPQNSLNLTFHAWSGWVYVPKGVERSKAVGLGDGKTVWAKTKAKNHMIVFDARSRGLGRLEWFEPLKGTSENSGRVNIYLKTPANEGKLKQLLANAFFKTMLFFDANCFDRWANTARLKGAHLVKDLGVPLPYSKTEFLKEGLGVVIKTGDLSHRSSLEIEFAYPDWAEKNERLLVKNKILLAHNVEAITQSTQMIKHLFPDQPTETKPNAIPRGIYE